VPVAAVRPFVDGETIDLTAPESSSPVPSPAAARHKKVNSVTLFHYGIIWYLVERICLFVTAYIDLCSACILLYLRFPFS
jgi:hypothetical protein